MRITNTTGVKARITSKIQNEGNKCKLATKPILLIFSELGKQTYTKSIRDEKMLTKILKCFKSLSSSSRIVFHIILFLLDLRLGFRIVRLHIIGHHATQSICLSLFRVASCLAAHRTAWLFGLGWSRSLLTNGSPTQQVNAFSPAGF